MDKFNIPILLGTKREKRRSISAANFVLEIGKSYGEIETFMVDPKDFNFPGDGSGQEGKDSRYTKITAKADGFFIVSPEYNHSFPGTLKRMLDSELKNYIHKPVAFAGVSNGPWGGVRMIEALVNTVREMGMVATFTDVHFPRVQDIFDEKGKLLDEAYTARVKRSFDELIWMARALKHARENIPSEYHKK
jgi:NAD(P)H-dependent FMN reductase